VLWSVLEGAALKILVSDLREHNAKDQKERHCDWTGEEFLHLTRTRSATADDGKAELE
jgi:hypothetical protein